MPKEVIRDEASMYDVQVIWSRNKYVQVGIETADGVAIAERLFENRLPDAMLLSEEQQAAAEKERRKYYDQISLAQFTGLWGTLDREGCNRLIRTLRRARDQAFGADA